ncbi:MAG: hypothetical protein CFE31_12375 [Rhizobiales bacterium PAR1]|nr:MAG: hypothetical protein CFE31_12375 [Rhizobiales bacterium PAR1]
MGVAGMTGWLIALGGLFGASGVALSAMAAHSPEGANLKTAADFLLVHGPAFFALAALARAQALPRWVIVAGALALALGLAFFAGDLTRRSFTGYRLFPMAAPTGGTLMILGWAWFALAGIFSALRPAKPAKTD